MKRWIVIAVLGIALVGTGVWGYQEHQEKNAVLIQAENDYQRAFHNLSYHVDLLHDKIGTALAMSSDSSLSPQLLEIWRLTSEALSDVGQLPLALIPFNKTEEFLSNIGDFTYETAVRDLENEPLEDEEVETLESLYEQSGEIKDEMRKVQHVVLENNLRWMDVELALAAQEEQADNTIVDGFQTVEKKVEGFAESNANSSIIGTTSKEHKYQGLSGSRITEDEALEKGKELFNIQDTSKLNITETGDGADIPLYSISYKNGQKSAYMDISEQGGHPISLIVDRTVEDKEISLNQGQQEAEDYLRKHGFENMTLFQSSEYNNVGVYSFLYNQNDVRIYSDSIELKVALDNGDILGVTARDYFMNHQERSIPEPELSVEEAKEKVNDNVDIQEQYMAVIDSDLGEEVLVYEFLGIHGDDTYRIFINAMDGTEEKVERLKGTEIKYASIS
ncbi:germination protein YpeB [Oceanobacillus halotolerans]|uniref:germination protein YpeB n=1 Tax=Oceanobacillus halotolerans TaxID=2663380 RepID=UPI0013DCA48C|nr:germination protein YpeB [Oceanobacillus halotolerans]